MIKRLWIRNPWAVLVGLLVALALVLNVGVFAYSATTNPGKKQAATHQAMVTTAPLVPFIQTLHVKMKGCECPTVFQLQRALKAAGFRPKSQPATGYFGTILVTQVKAFQRAHHISATGVYGKATHHALSPFYDKAGRARLIQVQASRRIVAITHAIVVVTAHARLVGGNTLTYSQSSSRNNLPSYPGVPPATDCSGYVTWVYQSVGLPDPSGWAFHPAGWTGSLAQHGVVVSAAYARIGDLVFYGGGFPFGHVAIVYHLHPTMVSSHGEAGIHLLPITYRNVAQVRRYF